MPKVYQTEFDKYRERLNHNLKKIEGGRTVKEMARVIGASERTYYSRRADPTTLSAKEIYRLCRNAGIDIQDFTGGRLKLKGE